VLLRLAAVMSIFFKFNAIFFINTREKDSLTDQGKQKQSDYFTGLIYKNTFNIKSL